MNSIYELLQELCSEHIRFINEKGKHTGYTDLIRFDLANKNVWNRDILIICNGEVFTDTLVTESKTYTGLKSLPLITKEDKQLDLQELYKDYKYSYPDKFSSHMKSNFYALSADELTSRQLLDGKNRNVCRARLEGYIMFNDLKHLLKDERHFFWQGEDGLVLLREWL